MYGTIPHGYVIHHIDNNEMNDELSNLDCIAEKENLRQRKKKHGYIKVYTEASEFHKLRLPSVTH